MLPPSHLQIYREFQRYLEEVKEVLSQDTVDRSLLKSSVAKLQDFFQNQILVLESDGLDDRLQQQVGAFQVEINKQLKLLCLDSTFLQAAKQPITARQRIQQAGDRLVLLDRYCDALLTSE